MTRALHVVLALVAVGLSASAAVADMGTEREKQACRHDVVRHCRAVMNDGEESVGHCLVVNAASISRACQQVLRSHGQL
jgi:hypothetical protein